MLREMRAFISFSASKASNHQLITLGPPNDHVTSTSHHFDSTGHQVYRVWAVGSCFVRSAAYSSLIFAIDSDDIPA